MLVCHMLVFRMRVFRLLVFLMLVFLILVCLILVCRILVCRILVCRIKQAVIQRGTIASRKTLRKNYPVTHHSAAMNVASMIMMLCRQCTFTQHVHEVFYCKHQFIS